MRLLALSSLVFLLASNDATTFVAADSGLYPPGLLPLINRANVLLSAGQFNEAARIYSEAIGTLSHPSLEPLTVNSIICRSIANGLSSVLQAGYSILFVTTTRFVP